MDKRQCRIGLTTLLGTVAGAFCLAAPASASGIDACCQQCPPPYVHCQEGPPRLKFKLVCPKPVCGPCDLKNYGYYPTCWSQWPNQPNYGHCPTPQAGAYLQNIPVAVAPPTTKTVVPLAQPPQRLPPASQR